MLTAKSRARRGQWAGVGGAAGVGVPEPPQWNWAVSQGLSESQSDPMSRLSHGFMNSARCPRVLQDGAPVCSIVHLCHSAQPVQSVRFTGTTELRHLAWQEPVPFHTGLSQSLFSPLPKQSRGSLFSPLPVRTSQRECLILRANLQIITNKNNTSLVSIPKGLGRMIEIPKALKRRKKIGPSRQPSCLVVLRVTVGEIQ